MQLSKNWISQQKKGMRITLRILMALVTLYVVFLLWLLPEMMEAIPMDTRYWGVKLLVAVLLTAPVYLLLQWCVYRFSSLRLSTAGAGFPTDRETRKRCRLWFAVGFAFVFAGLMIYFYAYFPGSFDYDNLDQWWQIQNSQYDTWHPVFHTLLIAFFSKLVNHYGFAVFMQLLLFSLLCGYLQSTLTRWGFPVWSKVLLEAFLVFNPLNHRILLFMWKDSAMTLFMLLFVVYLIQVWKTGGEWLKKKRNLVLWIVVLICISMVRHNSILYTIPFLILAFFFFPAIRRESVISLAGMIVGMLVIQYPVYDLVDASRPTQTYAESVGVPMTILCNIYETDIESLDPAAKEFLDQIAPEKRWQIYEMGNYNSLKFVSNANALVQETDPMEFLGFTARTVVRAPGLSLQAIYQVTRMVWDIRGDTAWHTDLEYQIYENDWGFGYVPERLGLRTALEDLDEWFFDSPFDWLFSYNGLHLLLLILCTLFVFAEKGWKAMVLTLPVLAYSYGTMLLLCGPTYRFFHFDSVIFLPLCLLLFTKWGGEKEREIQEE